ncbi:HORMA domain-containing protein 1-like isoform X1 [Asterias rubens]|uniref:HORMA domain-containing protein 1-like isoform X1 n=1 Tax=Asterias rubens TaxID=7604 RepID=UPI001454E4EE|nr:HORMA domain-containing protein 1-like isoform X1 [Asterias rubens]
MTATAQRVREKQKTGEWSSIFPTEQLSETQSALFVKKLLAVAVSNVMYLRTIFPEHAFGDRCLEDLHLKILKDDSACPGACQVIKWVKGCFDALDKKYLRTLTIGIYVDPNEPDKIIESYTFKFSYEGCGITIYRNDKKLASATTEAETKKATTRLLRTIVVLTQSLKSLPDDVILTMKLLYYDDVTPADYEPPGFQASESDAFYFEEEPMNVKIGDVSTSFHTVKLRIKTDRKQFELKDNEKDEEDDIAMETDKQDVVSNNALDEEGDEEDCNKSEQNALQTTKENPPVQEKDASSGRRQQQGESEDCSDVPMNSPHRPAKEDGASTPASSINMPLMNEEIEENTVRCPCECNEDDGLMICCEECRMWQHAVCFAIISEDNAPKKHICDQCSKIVPHSVKATDPYLMTLTPVMLQATCLWRRTLLAALEVTRIQIPVFSRRLGVEITVAHGLINRLEKEGYCHSANKGKRLGKVVNREKLQSEGLKKYFEKKTKGEETSSKKAEQRKLNQSALREEKSDKQKLKPSQIDKLAEQTADLNVSGRKLRSKQPPSKESSSSSLKPSKPSEPIKEGKKTQKRAVSINDDSYEFELASSQDPEYHQQAVRSSKRHKSSIVTRTVLV